MTLERTVVLLGVGLRFVVVFGTPVQVQAQHVWWAQESEWDCEWVKSKGML